MITLVSEERSFQRAQSEGGNQHHAEASDPHSDRKFLPGPEQDGNFRRESGEAGNAEGSGGRDDKSKSQKWHRAAELHDREIVEIARVRPEINCSGEGEEEGPDHSVREHLQNGTGNSENIANGQSEENKSHVADARVPDDEFQVVLPQSDSRCVNDPDDREDSDPLAPGLIARGKEIQRDAKCAVSPKLHHDSGQQH